MQQRPRRVKDWRADLLFFGGRQQVKFRFDARPHLFPLPQERTYQRTTLVCGRPSGQSRLAHFQRRGEQFSLSWGRVALLGIAQRQTSISFSPKTRKRNNVKALPASIKTIGDLIQVKRHEKNLTPGHLAAKTGIATRLVRSWEDGTSQHDIWQMKVLVGILGVNPDHG